MNSTTYLVLLGLMATAVCGTPVCPNDCEFANSCKQLNFQHMSDLQDSSVAPWDLTINVTEGREPQVIQYATCKDCIVEHMIAKPIYIQISVYQRIRNNTGYAWCKCPYDLAVGCTCVNKQ